VILSDGRIRNLLRDGSMMILPHPKDHQFQPASVDITLGDTFLVPDPSITVVNPYDLPNHMAALQCLFFDLAPGQFVLACTVEHVTLPSNIAAHVEGRSSLGRLGLMVHSTAGYVDPGWSGQITLELTNVAPWTIVLQPGMVIAQLVFEALDLPAQRPYGHPALNSRYQGQVGPIESRYGKGED
jgi:dCTP deaminase